MDKATTASVIGTILGLVAGIGGMLLLAPRGGDDAELARLQQQVAALSRQMDEVDEARKRDTEALTDANRRRDIAETANRELAEELEAKANHTGDARDDARNWKEAHDKLKAEAAEQARLDKARIGDLEGLLEDNGILEHLSDEEIAARVEKFKGAFETAFLGRDKAAAMQALWDLQKLGPKAYDAAIEVWKKMAEDFGLDPWGQGPGTMGMSFQDYVSLINKFGLIEHGLTDPGVDPAFRIASIYGLPWWTGEDPTKRTKLAGDTLLRAEGYEARAAIEALRDINDPATSRYLSDYLTANSDNPDARVLAVGVLATKNTSDGWAAIKDAAENDPDDKVKAAAQQALAQQNVTVAGLLINFVGPDSQAALAGIKVGDIMTHYNGVRVKTIADINNAKSGVEADQSVQVVVRRGDSDVTLTLGPGQIGINGVAVAPKD